MTKRRKTGISVYLLYKEIYKTVILTNNEKEGWGGRDFGWLAKVSRTKFKSAAMRGKVKRSERCRAWPIAVGDCIVVTVMSVVDQRAF
jgi:hypothetical protein